MPGKARVHELAKELGVSSKQLLSKAQDLGLYVRSPSSTIEAVDARRLRDAMTERGPASPGLRTWPRGPIGNNPYSAPPPPRSAPPPLTPVQRPRPMPIGPRPRHDDDDSFAAALRRAQAKSKPARPPHPAKPNPIVHVILARAAPSLRYTGEPIPSLVHEWAQMWLMEWFEPADVAAWMDAGLKGNEAHLAARLRREGWTPGTWASRGDQTTDQ